MHAGLGLARLFQMLFADASPTPWSIPSQLVPMEGSGVSSILRWRVSYPFLPAWQCPYLLSSPSHPEFTSHTVRLSSRPRASWLVLMP